MASDSALVTGSRSATSGGWPSLGTASASAFTCPPSVLPVPGPHLLPGALLVPWAHQPPGPHPIPSTERHPMTDSPATGGPLRADICVIGAGLVGLYNALQYAKRGLSV